MTNLIAATIRLTEEQKRFIDEKRKNEKGWDFSGWVREKLDELMHKHPSFLKQKIVEKQGEKIETSNRYDDEISRLKKELEEAEQQTKMRKERLEQYKPGDMVYGTKIPKKKDKEDAQ